MPKFKNALVSVSNKTGLIDFIKPLAEAGMRVVSTGGTAKYLKENGVEVVGISEQTGFPEVMSGRVKTLHPKVHMALLAREGSLEDEKTLQDFELEKIDLVVGNLYDFKGALKDGLEDQQLVDFIDIGGPSFLRAAAKNYNRITTICDPKDYPKILEQKIIDKDFRKSLAAKVFAHTGNYDSLICKSLNLASDNSDSPLGLSFHKKLRYGENPHQQANWFSINQIGSTSISDAEIIQGKALSYNNILDIDAAVTTLQSFKDTPTCVSIKHLNPCGVGQASTINEAVKKSLTADPQSVFGGIVALNKEATKGVAEQLGKLFLECVIAPSFSEDALLVLSKKKNLRVLKWADICKTPIQKKYRSVIGGMLVQDLDYVEGWQDSWRIHGQQPNESMKKDLLFSWNVCAALKSNAISICSNGQSLGLGMGQVNRVDAVNQAIERANRFHPDEKELVLASDAFFPFKDSIELLAKHNVKWVIQPGGSIRDEEVIECAIENGVNLVMTGVRHFNH